MLKSSAIYHVVIPTSPPTGQTFSHRHQKWHLCLLSVALAVNIWLFSLHVPAGLIFRKWLETTSHHENRIEEAHFDWNDITPTQYLAYTPCFDIFQCARLDVPLNWNSTEIDSGPRAALAVIKLPASVDVTDESYGGAIILNPGGPGESGVHQVLTGGPQLQIIVDSPAREGKHFDVISFDPRGVNNTTPRLNCFPDAFAQQAWLLSLPDYGLLWSSPSVIGLEWVRAEALAASCSRVDELYGDTMLRYVNTAQTVEDMLEIVERHGEWREADARRILTTFAGHTENKEDILRRKIWAKGEEMIQYWGFSYGTLLGQTFAAMHPSRILRMVIDGVLDAADHYSGAYLSNLVDSDKIISQFCVYCFQAGPEKCSLYTGSSVRDIEARFHEIMMGLKEIPISLPARPNKGPAFVTYSDIHLRMITAMAFSYTYAEHFFELLSEIYAGNATVLDSINNGGVRAAELTPECTRDGPFSDACMTGNYVSGFGSFQAISCMDSIGAGAPRFTRKEFQEYAVVLEKQSKWYAPNWGRNKIACVGYDFKPAWTFEGPMRGNTSHPLLVIGNTHDTVCPLVNAQKIPSLFPATVLQQDSEGHCSYSNPSVCTGRAVREYFQTGILPSQGTICQPEYKPFIGCLKKDSNGDCEKRRKDDDDIFSAITGLTDVYP